MPSLVGELSQQRPNSVTMDHARSTPQTGPHNTPDKLHQEQYFHSHHFKTPSARQIPICCARSPSSQTQPRTSPHSPIARYLKQIPTNSNSPLVKAAWSHQSEQGLTPDSTGNNRVVPLLTPFSASQPLMHQVTPGGSINQMTPGGSKHHITPGGSAQHITPGGSKHHVVFNPFEGHLLEKLESNSPMFSPNMFKVTNPGSAEQSPAMFRWSIDQLAVLKPAVLEELPMQQDTLNIMRDPTEEARVQMAIDTYFEQGNIVPSPWTDNVRKIILPRTPSPEHEPAHEPMMTPLHNSKNASGKQEAECQTVLTLPADFDLQRLLGEHYTYTAEETHKEKSHERPSTPEQVAAAMMCEAQAAVAALFESPADLSTSSLRRKLFFHGDEGTPLSPVRCNKSRGGELMDMSSPAVSPVRSKHRHASRRSPDVTTPASSQFSSSPIRGLEQTPSLRRCSTAPSHLDSPQISPITTGERGTGLHTPISREGCPSHKPLHSPGFSPIHPGHDGSSEHRSLNSPGFSPIPRGPDESYVSSPQHAHAYSRSDSLRRRALIGQTERQTTPPDNGTVSHLSPFSLLNAHAQSKRAPFCSSPSPVTQGRYNAVDPQAVEDAKCRIDFDAEPQNNSVMDVSHGETAACKPFTHYTDANTGARGKQHSAMDDDGEDAGYVDDGGASKVPHFSAAFRDFREDLQDFREDYDGEATTGFTTTLCSNTTHEAGGSQDQMSQDTGYQTQYSHFNEATMSTNLTNHFSNLPASLTTASSKDNSPTSPSKDLRNSLEEMSHMYNKISRSNSEVVTGENMGKYMCNFPLSSTMLSPSRDEPKDKPMEKVFEELQEFANKFSPKTSAIEKVAENSVKNDVTRLHKSCSMGEFRSVYSKGFAPILKEPEFIHTDGITDQDVLHGKSSIMENQIQFHNGCKDAIPCHDIHVMNTETESLSDLPSFDPKPKARPKTLSRSMSDFTGERLFSENDSPSMMNSLTSQVFPYKGRPAHSNPAFTLETLLPPSDFVLDEPSAENRTAKELSCHPGGSSNFCDMNQNSVSLSSQNGLACKSSDLNRNSVSFNKDQQQRFYAKPVPNDRVGNIRPRLLFADDAKSETCSTTPKDLQEETDVESQLGSATEVQGSESSFPAESLLHGQRMVRGMTSHVTQAPMTSPVSSRGAEHKVLMNAKRVLADQYTTSQTRTKRRSPSFDDTETKSDTLPCSIKDSPRLANDFTDCQ